MTFFINITKNLTEQLDPLDSSSVNNFINRITPTKENVNFHWVLMKDKIKKAANPKKATSPDNVQYCAKVMQMILDEYWRYLTRFYLKRYIVRAIVLFLGEISLSLCKISFPASDISFLRCEKSFRLCDILFLLRDIYRFCFVIYRFCLATYCSSLSSGHCEIHVHFPKDISW